METNRKMKRGDLVEALFDTGAMGAEVLYGEVIKAGPSTYTVLWESWLRNRVCQGYHGVKLASNQIEAEQAMVRAHNRNSKRGATP